MSKHELRGVNGAMQNPMRRLIRKIGRLRTAENLSTSEMIDHATANLQGWCSPQKAHLLAELIIREDLKLAVEVGVFGGRSLLPQALAMRETKGIVYGVEPWDNEIAAHSAENPIDVSWWTEVDLTKIKEDLFRYIGDRHLWRFIRIVELSSENAFAAMRTWGPVVDLLHIDGGHSSEQASRDVSTWCQLVRPRGIIVLDDISWEDVRPTRDSLAAGSTIITEVEGEVSFGIYRLDNAQSGSAIDPRLDPLQ